MNPPSQHILRTASFWNPSCLQSPWTVFHGFLCIEAYPLLSFQLYMLEKNLCWFLDPGSKVNMNLYSVQLQQKKPPDTDFFPTIMWTLSPLQVFVQTWSRVLPCVSVGSHLQRPGPQSFPKRTYPQGSRYWHLPQNCLCFLNIFLLFALPTSPLPQLPLLQVSREGFSSVLSTSQVALLDSGPLWTPHPPARAIATLALLLAQMACMLCHGHISTRSSLILQTVRR